MDSDKYPYPKNENYMKSRRNIYEANNFTKGDAQQPQFAVEEELNDKSEGTIHSLEIHINQCKLITRTFCCNLYIPI